MKVNLRMKLLVFASVLALIPLGISGGTLIRITRDELKSSVNDNLSFVAAKLAQDIDAQYVDTWRTPLLLMRNAIDSPQLGLNEKVALLQNGTRNVPDIVALQLTLQGVEQVWLQSHEGFRQRIEEAGLNATNVLKTDFSTIEEIEPDPHGSIGPLRYLPELDTWLQTIVVRMESPIAGRTAYLTAMISLDRVRETIESHPFNRSGHITIIQPDGTEVFGDPDEEITTRSVVQEGMERLASSSLATFVAPYHRPDGEEMLTTFGFPNNFPWAIIVEEPVEHAYSAVSRMAKTLTLWVILGFAFAAVAGVFGAQSLSRPIVEIGRVAEQVGSGDLSIRVKDWVLKSRDEIGELGTRMNRMITELRERFELQKFVSQGTMQAIQQEGDKGISLGGERKTATVFFSDIRGFTKFSEGVEPEVVIDMLNTYLRTQAHIVKKFNGDIDKYVGDELVAVFQGENMVADSIRAAVEIQNETAILNAARPEWNIGIGIGINTGDMVMGAMGSEDRMDYTILGDNVNLGARLCSHAGHGQILLSQKSYEFVKNLDWIKLKKLDPIKVKGKAKPIQIYEVESIDTRAI